MGNAYSEEWLDEQARSLIVGQTAADLQSMTDPDYCTTLLRNSVALLHSVKFPALFTFKGKPLKYQEKNIESLARYYILVAQCLSLTLRTLSPKYVVDDQLVEWRDYQGGGKMFQFEDMTYFFKDKYNLFTGKYDQGNNTLHDEPAFQAAFAKREAVLRFFSELLRFPPDLKSKVADFRKLLVQFEPVEKWLDLQHEKLKFNLAVRRIHSLQKI